MLQFRVNVSVEMWSQDRRVAQSLDAILSVAQQESWSETESSMGHAIRDLIEFHGMYGREASIVISNISGKVCGVFRYGIVVKESFGVSDVVGDCGDYKAWLQSQPALSLTGEAQDGENCPIQVYLTRTNGNRNFHVGKDEVFYIDRLGQLTTGKLPDWVRRFVYRIDHRFSNGVTAGEALQTLDDIC